MRKAPTTRTRRTRKFFAPLIAVLMLALSLVVLNGPTASAGGPLYICHATGETNSVTTLEEVKGFVVNHPSNPGDVSGHVGVEHQDGWDIIPPQPGIPEGQNWTEYGQEVYSLGCNLPAQDATASVQVGEPTCTSTSPVTFQMTNATSSPATPDQTVGTHSVTFTADYGHRFDDGSKTLTLSYTVLPALTCVTEIAVPLAPSVTDPCGSGNATWNVPADTAMFEWDVVDGDLIVTILAANTVFVGTDETTHNFGKAPESNTAPCIEEIAVPDAPSVTDPCGSGNATWNVPADTAVFEWDVVDGDLIVTILSANTVFERTGETTHNFGEAVETNVEACEVLGEQLEIPAEPGMRDPCGAGNARWVVPADTNKLDWTLTDGVLSVELIAPDTVFEGTNDTTYRFGKAVETNKDPCEVGGEEGNDPPLTVEVAGEQATPPTAVDAGLGAANSPIPAGRNPLWLLAVGGGLGLIGSAGLRRRMAANR